ncbi:MAG TPA: hypothetical protein DCQ31_06980 [Bacteroidales bacterium]|nr:hypothetical protein [Bacteroidales bacterium]
MDLKLNIVKRRNIPIRQRLAGLVAIIIISISLAGIISFSAINNLANKRISNHNLLIEKNNVLAEISGNIQRAALEGKNFIISSDEDTKVSAEIELINRFTSTDALFKSYATKISSGNDLAIYNRMLAEYDNYKKINLEILGIASSGKDTTAFSLSETVELYSFNKIMEMAAKLHINHENDFKREDKKQAAQLQSTIKIAIITAVIVLIFMVMMSSFIIRDLSKAVKKLLSYMNLVKKGKVPNQELDEFTDEVGQLASATHEITLNLKRISHIADNLSKGIYDDEIEITDEDDIIGNSLNKLKLNLQQADIEEEKRKREDTLRNWTSTGLAKFGELLRLNASNVEELGHQIIKNLVQYLEINQGGIYSKTEKNESYELTLISAFAYDRHKYLNKTIMPGEGLVGAVAEEQETVYITEIPDDYVYITSGLGKANPTALLIVPLKSGSDLFGVLELASFDVFEQHKIEFIEKLGESIATTLSTVRINSKTAFLLDESQRQSEEIAAQEEEMRQNLEEMRATQEEFARRELETQAILSAIDAALLKAELAPNGAFTSINHAFEKLLGDSAKQLSSILQLADINERGNIEVCLANVIKGKQQSTLMHIPGSQTHSGYWLSAYFTPVLNRSNKVSGILFFANNITELKNTEMELQTQQQLLLEQETFISNILQSQIEESESAVLELKKQHDLELSTLTNQLNELLSTTSTIGSVQLEQYEELKNQYDILNTELQQKQKELKNVKISDTIVEIENLDINFDSSLENKLNDWLTAFENE